MTRPARDNFPEFSNKPEVDAHPEGYEDKSELPPALNKMYCRECGNSVPANVARRPHCAGGGS